MAHGSRLTGLQAQVLQLYRRAQRGVRLKAQQGCSPEEVANFAVYARAQFERNRGIPHRNYQLIEHLLRQGSKQLALLSSPEVTSMHVAGSSSGNRSSFSKQQPGGGNGPEPSTRRQEGRQQHGMHTQTVAGKAGSVCNPQGAGSYEMQVLASEHKLNPT